ncbi:MAG: phosphatidylserine decarboxylase family protein [Betaproteobacteria bacterium]|nr:phosphatidylserine decarboxylase family protein [Betaproteobacteria bacterium]
MRQFPWPHPIIAREGWPFLALAVLAAMLADTWVGSWLSGILWIVAIFVLQFFRDPPRVGSADPDDVLSPADGRIVAIELCEDAYADRPALKISVFMNVFNVHSNRAPLAGHVEKVNYFGGSFFNAALDKASLENERNAVVIRDAQLKKAVASLLKRTIMLQVSMAPRQKSVLGAFTGSLIYSPQPRFFVVLPRLFKA